MKEQTDAMERARDAAVRNIIRDGTKLETVCAEMGFDAGVAYAAALEAGKAADEKPKVVCFCGSTRFTPHMLILRWEMEKQGIITMGWNVLPDGYGADSHVAEAEGVKELIDELHKRKIDLCDEVFVVNLDGYIGESTRSEIDYAVSIGKPIQYLEPTPYEQPDKEQK
jgi:hypothetical protein